MIDFTNANSLRMMFLLIMGYFWYLLAKDFPFCFNTNCFLELPNIFGILILGLFTWMIFKLASTIKEEEDLTTDIKKLTKDKLILEREILKYKYNKLS